MRDRLIEIIKKTVVPYFAEFIADDLIADGWMKPPMNIGQKCFILGYDFGECKECVMECRVSCVTQKKNGSFAIRISNTKYSSTYNFTPDEIGKTVFLTREEAEQALKDGEQE
jgi:hypothetical protein